MSLVTRRVCLPDESKIFELVKGQNPPASHRKLQSLCPEIFKEALSFQDFTTRFTYNGIHPIGEGTYGSVFIATDNESGDLVAIKKSKMCSDHDKKLLSEISIIWEIWFNKYILQSDGIDQKAMDAHVPRLRTYCLFENLGGGYLAFDLVPEAETVFYFSQLSLVKKEDWIRFVIHVGRSVLETLVLIGEHAFHGDLSINNVLVSKGSVKVIDFGLGGTSEGHLCGKSWPNINQCALFRSPKAFKGFFSHEGDIWALGVLLYNLIVDNSYPFGGDRLHWEQIDTEVPKSQDDFLHRTSHELSSCCVEYKIEHIVNASLKPTSRKAFILFCDFISGIFTQTEPPARASKALTHPLYLLQSQEMEADCIPAQHKDLCEHFLRIGFGARSADIHDYFMDRVFKPLLGPEDSLKTRVFLGRDVFISEVLKDSPDFLHPRFRAVCPEIFKIEISPDAFRNRFTSDPNPIRIGSIYELFQGFDKGEVSPCLVKRFCPKNVENLKQSMISIIRETWFNLYILPKNPIPGLLRLRAISFSRNQAHLVFDPLPSDAVTLLKLASSPEMTSGKRLKLAKNLGRAILTIFCSMEKGSFHGLINIKNIFVGDLQSDEIKFYLLNTSFGGTTTEHICGKSSPDCLQTLTERSPEAYLGQFTNSSDLWALGCDMFFVILGFFPISCCPLHNENQFLLENGKRLTKHFSERDLSKILPKCCFEFRLKLMSKIAQMPTSGRALKLFYELARKIFSPLSERISIQEALQDPFFSLEDEEIVPDLLPIEHKYICDLLSHLVFGAKCQAIEQKP